MTALGDYRLAVQRQNAEIGARRARQAERVVAQQTALMEARRRCRLLEKLKEKRFEEWRAAGERQIEDLASESFLARWNNKKSAGR